MHSIACTRKPRTDEKIITPTRAREMACGKMSLEISSKERKKEPISEAGSEAVMKGGCVGGGEGGRLGSGRMGGWQGDWLDG